MEMFDSNKSQINNIKKDNKKEDKKNIYIPIADSYSFAVAMMYMH